MATTVVGREDDNDDDDDNVDCDRLHGGQASNRELHLKGPLSCANGRTLVCA